MPFRLDEFKAKIQFITSAEMPSLIYKACVATETPSNTRYIQEAVCERLSRDLDIPMERLLERLPPPRGKAAVRFWEGRPVRKGGETGAQVG
jgi:hypothetical protein